MRCYLISKQKTHLREPLSKRRLEEPLVLHTRLVILPSRAIYLKKCQFVILPRFQLKLCLVYFSIDKSTCVVETKKLRNKETGEPFTDTGLEKRAAVAVKNGAMVIALDGKDTTFI